MVCCGGQDSAKGRFRVFAERGYENRIRNCGVDYFLAQALPVLQPGEAIFVGLDDKVAVAMFPAVIVPNG